MDTFAKRLKKERLNYKLTQLEFADWLGIPVDTYRGYESLSAKRHRDPDFTMLVKIADILEVSVDYLLGRVDIP